MASPYSIDKERLSQINMAEKIIESRGYAVINFNTRDMIEELELDWKKDFYDPNHVNLAGAEKYTEFLAEYIAKNYKFEDHRYEEGYDSWHEAYDYYMDYKSTNR